MSSLCSVGRHGARRLLSTRTSIPRNRPPTPVTEGSRADCRYPTSRCLASLVQPCPARLPLPGRAIHSPPPDCRVRETEQWQWRRDESATGQTPGVAASWLPLSCTAERSVQYQGHRYRIGCGRARDSACCRSDQRRLGLPFSRLAIFGGDRIVALLKATWRSPSRR